MLYTSFTFLHNSIKLWAMLCKATQDGQVIVKSSDKMWSTRGGNGNPLQYSCLENPMNSMKRQKDMTLEDKSPLPPGWKVSNTLLGKSRGQFIHSSRKNEVARPKWKQCSVVVKVKSDAVKNSIAWEPVMLGPWIKVNWMWTNRR